MNHSQTFYPEGGYKRGDLVLFCAKHDFNKTAEYRKAQLDRIMRELYVEINKKSANEHS